MIDKEKLASWMMQHGYATGHGESVDDLLAELYWQIEEKIASEREACAKVCEEMEVRGSSLRMHQDYIDGKRRGISQCVFAIRARSK